MPEPVQGACCGGIEIGVRDGFPDAESFAKLLKEALKQGQRDGFPDAGVGCLSCFGCSGSRI